MLVIFKPLLFPAGLTYSGTGGLHSGGSATAQAAFKPAQSGGAHSGGSAAAKPGYKTAAIGGAVTSGTATSKPAYKPATSGGAVSGGIAAATASFKLAATGGAVAVGSGSPKAGYKAISPNGGLHASGTAAINPVLRFSATSGLNALGAAGITPSFLFVASGTLQASGVALASVTSNSSQASAQPNFFQADVDAILSLPNFDDDALALFSFPDSSIEVDALMATQPDSFTAGGLTKPCVFMLHDQTFEQGHVGAGQQMAMGYALVKTADFPALKRGDAVIVNTVSFKVSLATRIQDGAVTQVFLGKA